MKQIQINTDTPYTVSIGSGVLSTIGDVIRQLTKAEKVAIVSDKTVWNLHGSKLLQALAFCESTYCVFLISPGEQSKNLSVYGDLMNALAQNGLSRTDCILAFGGGVVGDLAGFAAATYLRGIPYIQIPTTLLAMVDSSVGGKTAIDLPAGKNLIGAFHQPAAVLCDTDLLTTLPADHFRNGCAEVIKYGVLYDEELFAHLEQHGKDFCLETVITRCVELKRNAVEQDTFDRGCRMLLNFGHTIGHAIEQCSNYSILHGQAVSAGMAIVSRASKCIDSDRISSLLAQFDLPCSTTYSARDLAQAALSDKKRTGSSIQLILPQRIGSCSVTPIPVNDLPTFIEEGL